ncbi:hypothetical protein [Actinoplanes sp. NPDC020271]|uniref:hypothetical protein n=1 Tax=Actinoplanes sp. NPDC020271 TaxID=3363896 RepID=UPI0037A45917
MNMVAEMLLHEPAPVAIWAALWLATVPAMVVLASPAGVRNPGRALRDACSFLIGRPVRRRVLPEPAVIDFFAADATGVPGITYTVFAAEAADDGQAGVLPAASVRSAEPAAPAVPGGEVAAGAASDLADHESHRRSRLGRFLYRAAKRREERLRREAEAIRSVRYADEVRIAAESAGYAADRWQEHWESAAGRVDATFRAWQAADTRVRRSRQAAAFHTPATEQSPAEYADRERFLHLAVRAAAERGELPTSAVADALTGRGGWDARLHPVDQELVIQRACAAHLEAVWNRAVQAEARAWDDAQTSRRNWQSLCQEAILAEAQAAAVHHLLPPEPVTAPPAPHPAVLAQIA